MMNHIRIRSLIVSLAVCLLAAMNVSAQQGFKRIVSLNGAVTEIVCALGFESALVGVDVTSTYPASMKQVAKVGHNRNISAEPVLALQPDLILATDNFIQPAVIEQFKSVGVKTVLMKQEFSVAGTKKLITAVAAALKVPEKGAALVKQLDKEQQALHVKPQPKKVLFIYARGAGTMMVAGKETPLDKIIVLAGAQNAATGFNDFKPLTPEALVAANPDVILMFDDGLKSMGGVDGLLKVQGIEQTTAGKQKKVIVMDGQLLTGFGPRVIQAVQELAGKLNS
ncbi:heme/hemin ABC transporter substrate-binding protein [Chitinophaga filiformis]|uniref:Iron complex transport system substrate-binding protein n=1 Tax=Chitinophaga filiformis TaxID=104663 RepID=A0A1G7HB88_CHIFI|nr:helical backbone metal receptor [Chitinophaga filiformis]SDE97573.1 iron complex transport system substrate-binding protein [Chitinophaga filiformis]